MRSAKIVFMMLLAVACDKGGSAKYPGTPEGAKQLLNDIRKEGADAKAMTQALKPQPADYAAVFSEELAAKAPAAYDKMFNDPRAAIGAKPENTELKLWSATTEELRNNSGEGKDFPGGYRKIAEQFKPGVTWYRWKYTKPGEELGMAYDGLTFVNGHWAWFPKPWRHLEQKPDGG